jgi:hypothetical protein
VERRSSTGTATIARGSLRAVSSLRFRYFDFVVSGLWEPVGAHCDFGQSVQGLSCSVCKAIGEPPLYSIRKLVFVIN